MVLNKSNLIVISVLISFMFQGCLADKPELKISPEVQAKKLEKEKLHKQLEEKSPLNYELAKQSGYRGYVEYKSMARFVGEHEYGHIDINDYIGYIVSNQLGGTYAYKFSRLEKDIEVYLPDDKYGWILSIGIKRSQTEKDVPVIGAPLQNTETVSFLGVTTYNTRFGVTKKILIFDRAENFRSAYTKSQAVDLQKK